MKKEDDLISTLLQETYGHLSDNTSENEGSSLSEHFSHRENLSESGPCLLPFELHEAFVRFFLSKQILDIPFNLGIFEKNIFKRVDTPQVTPLPDFVLINFFSEAFNKKVSWMSCDSKSGFIQFLTRDEAQKMSLALSGHKKAA